MNTFTYIFVLCKLFVRVKEQNESTFNQNVNNRFVLACTLFHLFIEQLIFLLCKGYIAYTKPIPRSNVSPGFFSGEIFFYELISVAFHAGMCRMTLYHF